jgi:eukaryotic-like serine/threonine-protein kinase
VARVSWHPNSDDDDPTVSRQTRAHRVDDHDGDDDPTVARPGLRADELDDDPTIARPGLGGRPATELLDHRYQLVRQIGKGGMGEVWEARHVQLGRSVAIKFLTNDEGGPRFKREAQAIVSIRHAGVVDVLDFGETGRGVPYFVMELLDGETLATRVRRQGPLSWALVRSIAIEVSDALAYAHHAGVIHRDLKPSNVLILNSPAPRGSATKLIDFGIAKLLDSEQPRLTKTGFIQGTPAYMSPEQVLGETVDGRADIYGLGCLLYTLLCGRKPFAGKAGTAALRAQIYEMPPSFAEATPGLTIPAEVEALVFRAMAKQPELRFSSMLEMQQAILAIPPDAGASVPTATSPHLHPWPEAVAPEASSPEPALDTLTDAELPSLSMSGPGPTVSSAFSPAHSTASVPSISGAHSSVSGSVAHGPSAGRSLGETLQLAAAIIGSLLLIAAAIAGLIWALTS